MEYLVVIIIVCNQNYMEANQISIIWMATIYDGTEKKKTTAADLPFELEILCRNASATQGAGATFVGLENMQKPLLKKVCYISI